MDLIKIGGFLKKLRKEKGLTQEQLAQQFHVSRRSVSRWETGSNMPDLDTLIEMADFYEIDLREILDGERKIGKTDAGSNETVRKMAAYSHQETERKRKKLNQSFMTGGICFLAVMVHHQFEVLSLIFRHPIDDFLAGALTGLGLLFAFVGFYNNNHTVCVRQRKREFLQRKHRP